jgi:hypothetical protein
VNLLCSEDQGADAALHVNPRLDTSEVVFNSKEQGGWGREERGAGMPFQRGQPFEVLLIATDDGFKVRLGDSGMEGTQVPQRSVRAAVQCCAWEGPREGWRGHGEQGRPDLACATPAPQAGQEEARAERRGWLSSRTRVLRAATPTPSGHARPRGSAVVAEGVWGE